MRGVTGTVLVTGGSGSLGGAILRRAMADGWDASFVVYSRDEVKQATMRERFPDVRYVLGDVRDADSLETAMRGVDVVIHAAAYKRVPEAERETMACVQANVVGSMNVVREAMRAGIPRTIGISTDKACAPINAYGQSKALMERLFQSAVRPGCSFTLVRYGNVIASTGSVIPALRAQVAAGRPLTLTDPGMTRFWITLDDAVDLIEVGLSEALDAGQVLIPKSRASSMAVLAEAIAPGHPIEQVGVRAGEKRHEQLLNQHEAPYAYEWPFWFTLGPLSGPQENDLPDGFEYRTDTASQFSADELREVIGRMDRGETVGTLVQAVAA